MVIYDALWDSRSIFFPFLIFYFLKHKKCRFNFGCEWLDQVKQSRKEVQRHARWLRMLESQLFVTLCKEKSERKSRFKWKMLILFIILKQQNGPRLNERKRVNQNKSNRNEVEMKCWKQFREFELSKASERWSFKVKPKKTKTKMMMLMMMLMKKKRKTKKEWELADTSIIGAVCLIEMIGAKSSLPVDMWLEINRFDGQQLNQSESRQGWLFCLRIEKTKSMMIMIAVKMSGRLFIRCSATFLSSGSGAMVWTKKKRE